MIFRFVIFRFAFGRKPTSLEDWRSDCLTPESSTAGVATENHLKIKVSDITDRKLTLREPKSGGESEVAFMPEQIGKRLQEYVRQGNLGPEDRLFPTCYSTARGIIRKLGAKPNLDMTPHDLRGYSATYASRSGIPLEIVSKIILRHQDLKTTQAYLGKVAENEAIRWMDILHGRQFRNHLKYQGNCKNWGMP
jgi:integrase